MSKMPRSESRHNPALQEWADDQSASTHVAYLSDPTCDVSESKLSGHSEVHANFPEVPLVECTPEVKVKVEVEVRSEALQTELSRAHIQSEADRAPIAASISSAESLESSTYDQLESPVEVPELEPKELRPIGLERISDPQICEDNLAPQASDWAETTHTCSDEARIPHTMEATTFIDKKEPIDSSAMTLSPRDFDRT
ncbi:uncharacterized protein EI90DRAFT_3149356, partial [Cantharellus anzutake]|uniref:uncharacterized protein n=1 Tax=Cantharellus anzutake TaxID=1750568 RepID=UPI0019030075